MRSDRPPRLVPVPPTASALLCAALALATNEIDAMTCSEMPKDAIQRRIAALRNAVKPPEPEAGMPTVRFEFDLPAGDAGDGVFVIHSQRLQRPVYVGAYAQQVAITADDELRADGGWDNLDFLLLRPEAEQVCRWTTDPGHPFWGGSRRLRVTLTREREIDDQGLLRGYAVESIP